ncbi:anti-sigma regulatory factor [Aquibacillus sp. 3ASR75-11]|uniref:Anti-sigma regulatory factor n=1 Tax=Terrihalobacillus insolitus TaxID=2950438 RepID=A0A9X3WXD5_9BACI|nr:anti-sigma regulatory factor [Terrihalobacillus insolitus]MDC3415233.1 anti-sigma regulatory factor [Terrihalobacillus insolitus]MDC3426273.1 anti-sigma regulatory factor [Terrihalobacillus insolitus]
MDFQSCVTIQKEWDIVGARQMGRNIAKEIGFGTVDQARIATAISELARNIYLYAGSGEICFERLETIDRKGIGIYAIDKGPGMEEVSRVMEDGFSTSGGLGAGLPGVKRLMDEFDIVSEVGKGTKITVMKWIR